jgi:trk system potassium uptake protein TrkA
MEAKRYVVMGAGQVGFELARSLSQEGHNVTVIERTDSVRARVAEELDVLAVYGNGARISVLEAAGVQDCDLFMAVSSDEEANLAASLLAKRLGARRTAVRVETVGADVAHSETYEEIFEADLLLSTQVLTTTRILNHLRGLSTMAVEYFANGKVQLRKIVLDEDSPLVRKPLSQVQLPEPVLVVALFRGEELIIPSGEDSAEPGDEALVLAAREVIGRLERVLTRRPQDLGTVAIAGGGHTAWQVARELERVKADVKFIERDRARAHELAATFPHYQVIHGDATDLSLLRAERIDKARSFVALSGHDETNLMASLLAQELKIPQVIALVDRAETSHLWRRLGLEQVFSPRALANERIHEYIESDYSANLVSLHHGAAQVVQRRLTPLSPTAGVTLADISPPRGLIVGAVVRGDKVFVPHGKDRLAVGDQVILFVKVEEMGTVQLFFPGQDEK